MSIAWALNAWATNSWVGMNAGPPNAWRGDTTPPPVVTDHPSGGWFPDIPYKTREDVRRERIKLGILPEAALVIEDVAARQAAAHKQNRLDEQQRLEELAGELKLRGLEMQSEHIRAMNEERERLIHAEIGARLRAVQLGRDNENMAILLMLAL